IALALAAGVNIAANLILAPRLGAYGAAWAAVASDAALCVGCLVALRRVVTGFVPVKHWAVLLAGSLILITALSVVKQANPIAAGALTVLTLMGGFEAMSPLGLRNLFAAHRRASVAFDRTENEL